MGPGIIVFIVVFWILLSVKILNEYERGLKDHTYLTF